jgi:hypothetical protein
VFRSTHNEARHMIQPVEMKKTLPMKLHDGIVSTTTEVWDMLTAIRDGDLDRVKELDSSRPLRYTQPV